MRRFRIKVNEQAISYIERTFYENEMMKDNVAFLIATYGNSSVLESGTFKAYEQKQMNAKVTYESAKMEFAERYIVPVFGEHKITWEVDFRTKTVYITQLCDCEIGQSEIIEEVV